VDSPPAPQSWLKENDIITAIDGQTVPIRPPSWWSQEDTRLATLITLTVDRSGREVTLSITFDEDTPSSQSRPAKAVG
jgi:S1-C subfamily serine protease